MLFISEGRRSATPVNVYGSVDRLGNFDDSESSCTTSTIIDTHNPEHLCHLGKLLHHQLHSYKLCMTPYFNKIVVTSCAIYQHLNSPVSNCIQFCFQGFGS